MKTYHNILQYQPATNLHREDVIHTIEMHTGGEPLRIIMSGLPPLKGKTVLEYRKYFKENMDGYRKLLMWEPRGHTDMYGCVLTPPDDEGADFGVVFLHNEGYSTMCGHAMIALSALSVKMGWIDITEGINTLHIDTPCGRIRSEVTVTEDFITGISFYGVPSFVIALDRVIHVPGLGEVVYDLAFGGAFYAYVDLRKNNLPFKLLMDEYYTLIDVGMKLKMEVIKASSEVVHPYEEDLSFLYGTIFIGDPVAKGNHSRNVCIFANGEVDRCPTGSGVCGRIAIHQARGEIQPHEKILIESITGSVFSGSYTGLMQYGSFEAVLPIVEGMAYITGYNSFVLESDDPLQEGFLLR